MSGGEKLSKEPLACEVCNTFVPNQASLEAHRKGKRHIQNVERLENRLQEAERSIFITGIKDMNVPELALTDYFSKYGAIARVAVDKNRRTFAILEFSAKDATVRALEEPHHVIEGKEIIVKPREIKMDRVCRAAVEPSNIVHNHMPPEIWKALLEGQDTKSQFYILQQMLSLTDDDTHIRGLVCELLKAALEEVFHSCEIQQFGSSMNGIGIHGCDLDLNFVYKSVDYHAAIQFLQQDSSCRGNFLDENENKTLTKNQTLATVASIIKICVPDCHQVKSILSARRPVVKFHHKASGMCCDISTGNELAVRNTEYLRHLCENLPYFCPLVQAVRLWMKHWNLAGSTRNASVLLNNYAVTLMVLFYLHNSGEVHTLDEMRTKDPDIQPYILEKWDCSFSQQSPRKATDEKSLPHLFAGFFHFYSKFDFANKVLCLKSGKQLDVAEFKSDTEVDKMEHSGSRRFFRAGPLNVRDPFELNHNVAGNVSRKHMASFVKCIRNAALACAMKIYLKKPGAAGSKDPWGLLNLFIDHHAKKSPNSSPQNSFSEKPSLSFTLKTISNPQVKKDVVPLIITILTDVFLVQVLDGGSEQGFPQDPCTSPERKTILLQKFSKKPEQCDNSDLQTPESSRKRHLDTTPVAQKKARLSLSSPEALDIKSKASLFGKGDEISLPLNFRGQVVYRVWEGRRKARRHIVQPGIGDILDLERQISKLLVSECDSSKQTSAESEASSSLLSSKSNLRTFFQFGVTIFEAAETLVVSLEFHPSETDGPRNPEQDFKNFFHHLEMSLPNMVAKCLKAC